MIQLDWMGSLRDLNVLSVCVRLLLAMAFGGTIGFERGIRQRAAGLRTHMLLCVGAASTMLVSQYIYASYGVGDPARLSAQVISGIGFLGAGTIIVTGKQEVKGLTTAAGLWAAAIVGLVWLGQYLPKRLRTRRLSSPDTNQAVLAGYRCLTRLKKWGGTVPHEALELARKARFSQHTLTEEERQTMLCLLNAERAHLARRLSWWKRPLFRYLWGVPTDTGPDKEDTTDAQP